MADQVATACVILAAGKGTRMRSDLPKVLHRMVGRTLLDHVLDAASALTPDRTVVVISADLADAIDLPPTVEPVIQPQRRGTGDALRRAWTRLDGFTGRVVVVFGDTPLVTPRTLQDLADRIGGETAVAVFGMRPDDPGRYGRLVLDAAGRLLAIVEYPDATPEQRAIGLCNGGMMAFDGGRLPDLLATLDDGNAQGEIYLTDTVAAARARGWGCAVAEGDAVEALGVNTRGDLALVTGHCQDRLRAAAMAAGVTLVDPSSVHLSFDTLFGRDVVIEPMVVFGPGVVLGDRVRVHSFSHLEAVQVAADTQIGPHACLQPDLRSGPGGTTTVPEAPATRAPRVERPT